MNSKRINKWMVLAIAGIVLLSTSCKKDKPVLELPNKIPFSKLLEGTYKVYDTTGVFLYQMNLTHKIGYNKWGLEEDSLIFENFDGEFNFTVKQLSPNPTNVPNYIRIGIHDILFDLQGNRWKLGGGFYPENGNLFINDTIRFRFNKTNINYYLHDLTPYYACDCKQIAVKQH